MAEETTIDALKKIQPPTKLKETLEDQAGIGGAAPVMPEGSTVTAVTQEVQPDELLSDRTELGDVSITADKAFDSKVKIPGFATADVDPETGLPSVQTFYEVGQDYSDLKIEGATKTDAPVAEATTVEGRTGEMDAAQGELSQEAVISDVPQGEISEGAYAEAAQGTVSQEATVQYQLGELYRSIEAGQPLPAWAAGAARGATQVMQQRGLGASSMASAAMVQAIMESGIPIAAADAQTYAAMDMQNLNNRQQATLANAAMVAAMDRANLDARMTAAVNNAKAFLSIDLQNLDNRQKTNTINYQAELQALFNDQAAENAMEQFNAKNQIQVDQFFAELDVQTQNANANRVAAMDQFNVSESNAMKQFVASLNDSRDRFNQQMQLQVDQSNAVWRRDVNTANTAIENETNRINAQNLLNISQSAQNALWQKYRDEAAWIFQMSENAQQRAHQVGMLAMENDYNTENYEKQFELESVRELGKTAIEIIYGYAKKD